MSDARDLLTYIAAAPSPYHAVAEGRRRLHEAGFEALDLAGPWPDQPGRYLVARGGALIAWEVPAGAGPEQPFRIVGAHTDSPNLRVKQYPDRVVAGWQVVALQPYGGAWLNSWLDRDLGISGRLSVRRGNSVEDVLVRIDDPILRVPQLAIHLSDDRKGVSLDPQRHVNAVWGVGAGSRDFVAYVAERAGVDGGDVLAADLMTHDLTPSRLIGVEGELISAPRLDNQGTCYAGLEAFLAADSAQHVPVLALFDHEEVGSTSDHGAQSDLLPTVLERALARGQKVVVQLSSQERLGVVDDHLWTYADDSFLPHVTAMEADAAANPVVLTTLDHNPNAAQVRICAEGVRIPDAMGDYERIVLVFDGDDHDALTAAREIVPRRAV